MSLVLRLRQQGRKNKKSYRMVVADKRWRRDGRYIDSVGFYDPQEQEKIVVDKEKIEHWFSHGVKPTEKIIAILKRMHPDTLKLLTKKKEKQV